MNLKYYSKKSIIILVNRVGDQMKKKKKDYGWILAIFVFIIIVIACFFVGKYLYYKFGFGKKAIIEKNNISTVYNYGDQDSKITSITFENIKSISDLCGFDTGVCEKTVGQITLEDKPYNLYLYYNFDNTDEETAYLKINDTKIGNFVSLKSFYIYNNKYLVITELIKDTNNYNIHFYNSLGKEVKNITSTYNDGEIIIKDNVIYYYYCDINNVDTINGVPLKYYKLNELNNDYISSEYGKC